VAIRNFGGIIMEKIILKGAEIFKGADFEWCTAILICAFSKRINKRYCNS
jgi:hypothetical protein